MATIDTFRKGILPKASAEDVNGLLWSCTPFPFSRDVRKIRRMIRHHLKYDGTVEGAITDAHLEFDREWVRYQSSREIR